MGNNMNIVKLTNCKQYSEINNIKSHYVINNNRSIRWFNLMTPSYSSLLYLNDFAQCNKQCNLLIYADGTLTSTLNIFSDHIHAKKL